MASLRSALTMGFFSLLASASPVAPRQSPNYLIVTTVPDHVRPYIVRAYSLDGVQLGAQIYRFPVTGNSSNGAFTLSSTASPASDSVGVLPHIHKAHYENFFCVRGSQAVWANDQARILMPGDLGAVPHNPNHTYQFLAPYNELVGLIQPGGFEELFYFLAQKNYTSAIDTPFMPINASADGGSDASIISSLESFDVFAELTYSSRHDFVNDTAPAGGVWRSGDNALGSDSTTPFSVANDFGPKYLNNDTGMYQLIEPLLTPVQTDGNMTMGKFSISETFPGAQRASSNLQDSHTAIEVLDGQLVVQMEGQTVKLQIGDVAFVPAATEFGYWSEVAFTKVLVVGSGRRTLQQQLLAKAGRWGWAMFPSEVPASMLSLMH